MFVYKDHNTDVVFLLFVMLRGDIRPEDIGFTAGVITL